VFVAGDGGEVQIVCVTERHWQRLCAAIDRPEWVDEEACRDNRARLANRQLVHSRLAGVISTDTAASWVHRISERGALCEHVRDIEEAWFDERLVSRGLTSREPEGGPGWSARIPMVSLAGSPTQPLAAAPALGAHTAEVMRELGDVAAPGAVT
jgi:CoA:oxalate CoA-transferase